MKKLTAALIGCGAIARHHLEVLSGMKHIQIVGVCDLSAARASAAAERFSVSKWYHDFEDMLAEIKPSVVHVTTPPASHFRIVKACLAAGHHVLCEKPLTTNLDDYLVLRKLAVESSCMLVEGLCLRWHPMIEEIRGLASNGELGEILDVNISLVLNLYSAGSPYVDPNATHYSHALKGGVIGDFTPHLASLAYLFAGPVEDAHAVWTRHRVGSPLSADEFRAIIKGRHASAYVSFVGNGEPTGFYIRVFGSRMLIDANLYEPTRLIVRRARRGQAGIGSLTGDLAVARDVARGALSGLWAKLGGRGAERGIREMIMATYAALENGEPQPIPFEELDEVARLVDLFTRGYRQL